MRRRDAPKRGPAVDSNRAGMLHSRYPAEYQCVSSLYGMQDLAAERLWRHAFDASEERSAKGRFQGHTQLSQSISTEECNTRNAERETCV